MGYQEIKDYLDGLIHARDEARSKEAFNSNIRAILVTFRKDIQMFEGIEIVANVMGLQLDSEQRKDGETEFSFVYAGTKFFQLGSSEDVCKNCDLDSLEGVSHENV